jgi:GTPase SAR1 family protein
VNCIRPTSPNAEVLSLIFAVAESSASPFSAAIVLVSSQPCQTFLAIPHSIIIVVCHYLSLTNTFSSQRFKIAVKAKMATAIDHLAAEMKPMLLTIKKLTHYGVDSIADVSIPKIVMVGDQSTGKSSLVEALAEIQVPRGSGTCTRCPLEISVLQHPGPWTADIRLLRKWEPAPHDAKADNDGDFSGWSESQASIPPVHFATVTNKSELEHAIRLAQLANLNPTEDPKHFAALEADVAQKLSLQTHLQFSPNPVMIEIKGEELPNLSFVDLPGIISQSDAGYHLVTLVRNLAKYHMKQKNTLVLLVISMESDVMNSAASGLVSEVGAADRCVGVLTKPDRRDDSVTQYQEVLSGQKFKLDLGYFITKQPATHMLNEISYDQARAEETEFFKTPEWQKQFPHSIDRQGTRKLQCALSKQLVAIAKSSIPEIGVKIAEKLKTIEEQLSHLPEPTKAPRHEIEKIVTEFDRTVGKVFSCSHSEGKISDIRSIWKDEVKNFKDEILEQLRPKLVYGVDLDEPTRKRKRKQCETATFRTPSSSKNVKSESEIIDLDDSTIATSESSSMTDSGHRSSKDHLKRMDSSVQRIS